MADKKKNRIGKKKMIASVIALLCLISMIVPVMIQPFLK